MMVLKLPPPARRDAVAAASPSNAAPMAGPAPAALPESFLGRRSGALCLALLGGKEGHEYLVGMTHHYAFKASSCMQSLPPTPPDPRMMEMCLASKLCFWMSLLARMHTSLCWQPALLQ